MARELRESADRLERHYGDLCDIEFTVEAGRLWLLQVRVGKRTPRAALRIAADMARDPTFPLTREAAIRRVATILADPPRTAVPPGPEVPVLARGLGASPGLASGEITTDPEDALRRADAGSRVVLVRAETSPDDVHGMARAAGILTATGGLASHAAVVARGWGIPAVVGAHDLVVAEGTVRFPRATLRSGDVITIDGDDGRVFAGEVGTASDVAPEARELLEWAAELGLQIDQAAGTAVAGSVVDAASGGAVAPDDCLLVIGVKGIAPRDAIARALLQEPGAVDAALEGLLADGLAAASAWAFKLTDAGRERRVAVVREQRARLGDGEVAAALDAFLELDRRVKAIVTDWQIRPRDGDDRAAEPLLNDHSDPAYDADVVARLGSVHDAALSWTGNLARAWPAATRYAIRLVQAIDQVRAGDGRFVASPRVDSYHGIWFELHEDLIVL
ncbi:MAG TPA: PEP-utilizing enzyme, partial [Candidatus Binatus sp.]|nr:PEP-utilizing enzyme [Candidatus Binatus sp.]